MTGELSSSVSHFLSQIVVLVSSPEFFRFFELPKWANSKIGFADYLESPERNKKCGQFTTRVTRLSLFLK